jgi:hypothetical protein
VSVELLGVMSATRNVISFGRVVGNSLIDSTTRKFVQSPGSIPKRSLTASRRPYHSSDDMGGRYIAATLWRTAAIGTLAGLG